MNRGVSAIATVATLTALILGAVAPHAAGHGGVVHDGGEGEDHGEAPLPSVGGLTAYDGVNFWGDVEPISLEGWDARHPDAHGEWVVWEAWNGSVSDIHAYNLRTKTAVRVTDDVTVQRSPRVWGEYVVWEDYAGRQPDIWLHDLRSGASEPLVAEPGIQRSPFIADGLVAWADHRRGNWDIHALRLSSGEAFVVANGTSREDRPVVVGDTVAWLDLAYGQWDVFAKDVSTGERHAVTRDLLQEEGLITDGRRVLFFQRPEARPVRTLMAYEPATGDVAPTGLQFTYYTPLRVEGDVAVAQRLFGSGAVLQLHNLREGFSADLNPFPSPVAEEMALTNNTIITALRAGDAGRLLAFRYHPLALHAAPEVHVTAPELGERVFSSPRVEGFVTSPAPWPAPAEVLVRVDSGPWQRAQGATEWSATINNTDLLQGSHTIQVAAVYEEGPPVYARSTFVLGSAAGAGIDLGSYYEREAVALHEAILRNPALAAFIALLVVAALLVAARTYLRWLRRRPRPVEYVPPEE